MSEKRATYYMLVRDAGGQEPGNLGDAKNFKRMVAENVWAYLEECGDGESVIVEFGRVDMTKEQEEAMPEL